MQNSGCSLSGGLQAAEVLVGASGQQWKLSMGTGSGLLSLTRTQTCSTRCKNPGLLAHHMS